MAAYVIEDAAVFDAGRPILRGLDVAILHRRTTVLLGPGGAGKSTLLHALSGRRLPGDLQLTGTWRLHDAPRSRWEQADIFLLPQRRASAVGGTWRDALASSASIVLLDEPCVRAPAAELDELTARLHAERGRRTVVIATHHMSFARAVADQVVLLCGGTVDCAVTAATFFGDPPTPMAQRIIDQGNCWPTGDLPSHLRWVSPQLAGMARPGLVREIDHELGAVAAAGIRLVVSLTETPLARDDLERHGLFGVHFPIRDMSVPELAATARLCELVARWLAAGHGGVVMHCHGGIGRTGTLLATQLVHAGRPAADAIRTVRAAIRHAIQTAEQEEFVHRYERARAPRM
jgi:atypical dual specificity phosphatase